MKALVTATVTAMALCAMAWTGTAVASDARASEAARPQKQSGTVVNVIVRPDGGGLDADPDVGMPAFRPAGLTPPADRR